MRAGVSWFENGISEMMALRRWQKAVALPDMNESSRMELRDVAVAAERHDAPVRKAAAQMIVRCAGMPVMRNFHVIMKRVSMTADIDAAAPMQYADGNGIRLAESAPAANGNANPAMSLSSVISLRIFAKVAIIFLTLRGLTEKSEIKIQNHDNLST